MKTLWQRLDRETSAMIVPGGMVIRTLQESYPTESTAAFSEALVFVPNTGAGTCRELVDWIKAAADA